ncbi:DUF2459 domain-containing protein [Hymenobacter seoulensis]
MSAFAAFLLFLLTGTLVPINPGFRQTPDGIPVYIVSNGFHTAMVLPTQEPHTGHNWLQTLGSLTLTTRFARYPYVGFGWGNEGFFLGSMGGKFPSPKAIVGAAFPSRTLMHVDFYRAAPDSGAQVVPLRISPAEYRLLTAYVQHSFRPDTLGRPQLRQPTGYTPEDFFFLAQGRYHAFRTCNDWTNRGLRTSGLRAALKAPFAAAVMFQTRKAKR